MIKRPRLPRNVLKFFQQTGAEGGKTTAIKYSKEQRVKWGKMGGRPKASVTNSSKEQDRVKGKEL
jgi:hypothetical protein